jgi:succinate dehydrogenase and fumarate reductase iron-sulfur protein
VRLTLKVWRQSGPDDAGRLVTYQVDDASEDMSFLELIDVLNERLILDGEEPVAFDHDCREGICGACSMVINGEPHGPQKATTTCQLHLRHFRDGETITVEPFRAGAFPVVRDLVVDRSAFDRVIAAGGYITAPTGTAPEAHSVPVPKPQADRAFAAATCIGCGACVAACPNGSASLFLGAKITHLGELPQGQPERYSRVLSMVEQHDAEGFGGCTNTGECAVACPKEIPLDVISQLNRDYLAAKTSKRKAGAAPAKS